MNQPNQQQQEPEVTLVVKASWIGAIMAGLDEIPHKFSRPIIDSLDQQARDQLQRSQAPVGPLTNKVVQ